MSEDNYWWACIDADERWQWEQMQRLSTGKPGVTPETQNGLPIIPDLNANTNAQQAQEKVPC